MKTKKHFLFALLSLLLLSSCGVKVGQASNSVAESSSKATNSEPTKVEGINEGTFYMMKDSVNYYVNDEFEYFVSKDGYNCTDKINNLSIECDNCNKGNVVLDETNHKIKFLEAGNYTINYDLYSKSYQNKVTIFNPSVIKIDSVDKMIQLMQTESPRKYCYEINFEVVNLLTNYGEMMIENDSPSFEECYPLTALTAEKDALTFKNGEYHYTAKNTFDTNVYTKGIKQGMNLTAVVIIDEDENGDRILNGVLTGISNYVIQSTEKNFSTIYTDRKKESSANRINQFAFEYFGKILAIDQNIPGLYTICNYKGNITKAFISDEPNSITRLDNGELYFDIFNTTYENVLSIGDSVHCLFTYSYFDDACNYVGGYILNPTITLTDEKIDIKKDGTYHLPIINYQYSKDATYSLSNSTSVYFDEEKMTITPIKESGNTILTITTPNKVSTLKINVEFYAYSDMNWLYTNLKHLKKEASEYIYNDTAFTAKAKIVNFIDKDDKVIDSIDINGGMIIRDLFSNNTKMKIKYHSMRPIITNYGMKRYEFKQNFGDENLITDVCNAKAGDIIKFNCIVDRDLTLLANIVKINNINLRYHRNYKPGNFHIDFSSLPDGNQNLDSVDFKEATFGGSNNDLFTITVTRENDPRPCAQYSKQSDGTYNLFLEPFAIVAIKANTPQRNIYGVTINIDRISRYYCNYDTNYDFDFRCLYISSYNTNIMEIQFEDYTNIDGIEVK